MYAVVAHTSLGAPTGKGVMAEVKAEYVKAKEDMGISQHQSWTPAGATATTGASTAAAAAAADGPVKTEAMDEETEAAATAAAAAAEAAAKVAETEKAAAEAEAAAREAEEAEEAALPETVRPTPLASLRATPIVEGLVPRRLEGGVARPPPLKRPKITLLG